MTNQSTIDKLIEMRLTTMSDAFLAQKDDLLMKNVPFEDRFGMLVDIEYSSRKNNRRKRLIKQAGFDQSDASIIDINYTSGASLTGILSRGLQVANISWIIATFLSLEQPAVAKLIWPALSVWRLANSITRPSMSDCRTF